MADFRDRKNFKIGRYIKLGTEWVFLDDIKSAARFQDGRGKGLTIRVTGRANIIYRNKEVDIEFLKRVLEKEGKGEQ